MSRFRKYARILGSAPRKTGKAKISAEDFERYTVELDNALACMAAALRATIKPMAPKRKKML